MNINATLLGQAITFAILIGFTMKWVWPPIMQALDARQKKIADGLAAAREGELALEKASEQSRTVLAEARHKATVLVEQAAARADHVVREGAVAATAEGERIIAAARDQIEQEIAEARRQLQQEIATLVGACTEKLIARTVDVKAQQDLIDQVIKQL